MPAATRRVDFLLEAQAGPDEGGDEEHATGEQGDNDVQARGHEESGDERASEGPEALARAPGGVRSDQLGRSWAPAPAAMAAATNRWITVFW